MGKPEGTIENHLRDRAKELNFLCYKFVSPGTTGVPDDIVIGNGKTIFIETKAPGETLRKKQAYRIKQMRERGAIVFVADTKEEIDRILNWMLTPI